MLESLKIKNYVLIQELNFKPKDGLNTITGETGAGKSILLGALGLISGNRADVQTLLNKEEKCVVEAQFQISKLDLKAFFEENDLEYEAQTIIRREINPAGKSRAFVNDSPVTLDVLKVLGDTLLDVHSQNETQQLYGKNYQHEVLDFLTDSIGFRKEYLKQFKQVKVISENLNELKKKSLQDGKEQEYQLFLLNELNAIKWDNVNFSELEGEVKSIQHFTEVKASFGAALDILDLSEINVNQLMALAGSQVRTLSKISEKYQVLEERFQGLSIELQDFVKELVVENDRLDIDEEEAQQKVDLYNSIQHLLKKHGLLTVDDLIKLKDDLSEKLDSVSNLSSKIEQLEKQLLLEQKLLGELGDHLHQNRLKNAPMIAQKIIDLCKKLGISEADFRFDFSIDEQPSIYGLYEAKFLFSANKGIGLQEMAKAASGGEFSRLMFSIKSLMAEKTQLPTIIFDEIDTGISGEIALKMGELMKQMSGSLQMICITHLPQIAAKGKHHFFVYKDHSQTVSSSNIKELGPDERRQMIAEMIGGNNPGEAAVRSAEELMLN